jgi:DHA1 family tetracycline resistance protein-like MFS transporter
MLIPNQSGWFYLLNPFIALSYGIISPNLIAVVSEQATADQQGQILGINQSMLSLGNLLPPILAGYLNTLNGNFPLLAGALLVFVAWLVFMLAFRKKAQ